MRRCTSPTSGGGLAARRTIARDDSCSSLSDRPPSTLSSDERPVCKPSMRCRSARVSPRWDSIRDSLIEVMGNSWLCILSPKKTLCRRRLERPQPPLEMARLPGDDSHRVRTLLERTRPGQCEGRGSLHKTSPSQPSTWRDLPLWPSHVLCMSLPRLASPRHPRPR